jgi:hypothetical protein
VKTPDSIRQKQRRDRLKNGQHVIRAAIPCSLTAALIHMNYIPEHDIGDPVKLGRATADYALTAFKKHRHSVTRR